MSVLIEKEFPCTHCQFPNPVEVWSIVNVKEDPELKDILLGGELNMGECSSCRKTFYAESFLLYHDPEGQFLAFVYPHEARSEREPFEEKSRRDFELIQATALEKGTPFSSTPFTFFGLDELARVLEEEEEMVIQSEIVAALAPELKLPVRHILPSIARSQQVPRVIPGFSEGESFDRDKLLESLETVENANNLLSVYTTWRQKISKSPQYEMKFD